jgi:hypothetical protein
MDRTNREDSETFTEYERSDIDQVQPGEVDVRQAGEPALDIDQVQPGEVDVRPAVEPARDIDQVQPGDVYTGTAPGTEPLTGDLDTGHIDHEHVRDVETQSRLPIDQTQTTRPLAPGSAETRVLPPQPDTVPGGTTTTGSEDDFTPYMPKNDDTA